jgi:hypothetical protein
MHAANRRAIECVPVWFWYQQWLHLWLLLTNALLQVYHDTLSTSCNPTERNLMGLHWESEPSKLLAHLFLSTFITFVQKFCYHSAEMQRCPVTARSTSSKCSSNAFSENTCNMELLLCPSITCGLVWLLSNTPRHTLTENQCWKWYSATLCAKQCKFLMMVIPSQVNWASSMKRMPRRMCSHGCSHSQICTQLAWSGKWLHQSSWKFCVYLGFTALLPDHHIHTTAVHVLQLLVGRTQSSSKFCILSQMFCKVDITAGIPPQQAYHFHCRTHIRNACPAY